MRFVPILALIALPAAALAQNAQQAVRPAAASGDDKVICKTFADVGSLIATHKDCKTRREWQAEAGETQRRLGDCINTGAATGQHC